MDVEEYVKRKVKPIFDKVLKETSKNRLSVGNSGFKDSYVFYQPHNCRVYFDYVRAGKPHYRGMVVVKNSIELMFKDLILGCRVTIKRTKIEIINLVNTDKRYIVSMKDSLSETTNILVGKIKECQRVLKEVIRLYGGSSRFMVLKLSVRDNKVEHEDFIDSIGLRSKFQNLVVKKFYNSRNVEFSDPVFEANYLTNQAALMGSFDIVRWCEQNISCLKDVFKLEGVFRVMSFDNRVFVSNFLFERFGGVER